MKASVLSSVFEQATPFFHEDVEVDLEVKWLRAERSDTPLSDLPASC